jgi:hypothetical protein
VPYRNLITRENLTMPGSKWGREHPNEVEHPEGVEPVAPLDANEHGYWGTTNDPTPRHNYTVAGVVEGAPRPDASGLTGAGVESEGLSEADSSAPKRGRSGKHETGQEG